MKSKWLPFLFCLLCALKSGAAEPAQKWAPDFSKAFYEAAAAFGQRDFPTAVVKLDAAEKIKANVPEVANLRGAIMVEEKKYDEGAKLFKKALELNPELYSAKFNLAEIPFLQRKYADSRQAFEKLRKENPKDELVQFKIFLTYLLEKKEDEAKRELELLTFPSDTPAYYFAHAAWEFAHDNPDEAKKWMDSSGRIFAPAKNIFFATTMFELGWLKNRPNADGKRED